MTTQATNRRTRAAAGFVAIALAAATAWAVLTFAVGSSTHTTKAPASAKLSPSEQAYQTRGLASMYEPRLAVGRPSTATVLKGLRPAERRYVRGILALSPEQVRAGFGTVRP
jgi:hypothetical protein